MKVADLVLRLQQLSPNAEVKAFDLDTGRPKPVTGYAVSGRIVVLCTDDMNAVPTAITASKADPSGELVGADFEQINEVNETLWAELDEIKEKTGYNEYREANRGAGHWTLLGYLLNLKHRAADKAGGDEWPKSSDFTPVKRTAVEWFKQYYPALCLKSGLCERVGGRLYTISTIHPQTQAEARLAEPCPAAGMKPDACTDRSQCLDACGPHGQAPQIHPAVATLHAPNGTVHACELHAGAARLQASFLGSHAYVDQAPAGTPCTYCATRLERLA